MPAFPAFKTKPYYSALSNFLAVSIDLATGELKDSAVDAKLQAALANDANVTAAASDAVATEAAAFDYGPYITDEVQAALAADDTPAQAAALAAETAVTNEIAGRELAEWSDLPTSVVPTTFVALDGDLTARTRDGLTSAVLAGPERWTTGAFSGTQGLRIEKAATNLVPNSSFELSGSAPMAPTGATYEQSIDAWPNSNEHRIGAYSRKLTATTTGTPVRQGYALSWPATPHTISAYVYNASAGLRRFSGRFGTDGTWVDIPAGESRRVEMTFTGIGSNVTAWIGSEGATTIAGDTFYIDGFQIEESNGPTTYLDGSLGTGYAFTGTTHNSTSTRAATTLTIPAPADFGSIAFAYSTDDGATWAFGYLEAPGDVGTAISVAHDGTNYTITSPLTAILGPVLAYDRALTPEEQAQLSDATTMWTWKQVTSPLTTENGIPTGGTSGTVLVKSSASDFDATWTDLNLDAKADATLLPTGRRALLYPDHLVRFRAKVAAARFAQAHILCFGDSITTGQKSGSTTDDAIWRVQGWVPQLRSLFADRYGAVGEGILRLGDSRVVASGAQGIQSIGIMQDGKRLDNGDTLTVSLPACTDIKVYWWWDSDAESEPFSYTVDGGAAATATAPSGSDLYPVEHISGLADTTHTLVIHGPATGWANISAVGAYVQTEAGVAVHRFGAPGGYIDTAFSQATGDSLTRSWRLYFEQTDADLAIVEFGTNEGGSGQALGKNPTDFRAQLVRVVEAADTYGVDVLLMGVMQRDPSALTGPYYPEDFFAEMADVAALYDHVAYFDLQAVWGDYAAANGRGWMDGDGVHPNLYGHSDTAKLVYEALGGA